MDQNGHSIGRLVLQRANPWRRRDAREVGVSRVLCDARIPNICEGAAEIQAKVVGKAF